MIFTQPLPLADPLRLAITQAYRMDEQACLISLLEAAASSVAVRQAITDTANRLVVNMRERQRQLGGLGSFLTEYNLNNEEGIALMCLAEALLRVPDKYTLDRLIRDKLSSADWQKHLGQSDSLFMNVATKGLVVSAKLLGQDHRASPGGLMAALKRVLARSSEPMIRRSMSHAMKILSRQFIMGATIEEALKRAKVKEKMGYLYSYDMLGEAARTAEDAQQYFQAYQLAVVAMGEEAADLDVWQSPGISVKLSALHPRYEWSQRQRVLDELVPKVLSLARQAKAYDVSLMIDAEEAHRLDVSLDVIEAVFVHPDLQNWSGFGVVVQAYQKRADTVLDWLYALAKKQKQRLMVRLVKGAYWDKEIKEAQMLGLDDYPVFSHKAATDVSFLACAKKLLSMDDMLYPCFATHNAQSVASILHWARPEQVFEFQCLYGMGETLYDQLLGSEHDHRPCRVYAPVGGGIKSYCLI